MLNIQFLTSDSILVINPTGLKIIKAVTAETLAAQAIEDAEIANAFFAALEAAPIAGAEAYDAAIAAGLSEDAAWDALEAATEAATPKECEERSKAINRHQTAQYILCHEIGLYLKEHQA